MVYFNGDIYEGEWESDRKNGIGRLDKQEVAGSEKQDKEVGYIYIGEFTDDKRSGKGRQMEKAKSD